MTMPAWLINLINSPHKAAYAATTSSTCANAASKCASSMPWARYWWQYARVAYIAYARSSMRAAGVAADETVATSEAAMSHLENGAGLQATERGWGTHGV